MCCGQGLVWEGPACLCVAVEFLYFCTALVPPVAL